MTGSSTAGSACTTCPKKATCFVDFIIMDNRNEIYKASSNNRIATYYISDQKTKYLKGTLTGRCQNNKPQQCTYANVLLAPNSNVKYIGPQTKDIPIRYNAKYHVTQAGSYSWIDDLFKGIGSLVANIHYISCGDCSGFARAHNLMVYPTYKLKVDISYKRETDANSSARKLKKCSDYTREELKELYRNNRKAKWSDLKKTVSETGFAGEISVEVGEFKQQLKYNSAKDKALKTTGIAHDIIKLLPALTDSLTGKSVGPIRKITLLGPNFSIVGSKELKVSKDNSLLYYEGKVALKTDPLFGISVIIDVIDLLLSVIPATGPAAKIWRDFRQAMEQQKKQISGGQNGAYVVLGVDLFISGKLLGEANLTYTQKDKVSVSAQGGTQLDAEVSGKVEAGARIWFVKGIFEAKASLKTMINAFLVGDKKGIGFKWNFGGLKFVVEAKVSAEVKSWSYSASLKPLVAELVSDYKSPVMYFINFNK